MNAPETDEIWTLRTACFSLIAIILVTAAVETLVAVTMMILLGRDGYQTWRHSLGETALFYTLGGALALAVCVYFAKTRTWQEFTSAFALRPTTPRFLIVAGLLGVWIAFILRASRPGGAASVRFETAFNVTSASLLVYSAFEETVMRGFFGSSRKFVSGA